MENERQVTITFVFYNGMSFNQYGYNLSDAKTIANRFNAAKNSPDKSIVMTYESSTEPYKALVIDLKNIIGIFYQ